MLINVGKQEQKLSVVDEQMPYIVMTPEIYTELLAYIDHYETEVSGFGLVDVSVDSEGGTRYDITEVYLPGEQDNRPASTDIEGKLLATMVYELLQQGKSTEKMRLHWHSHADFGVFHSGTDTDNYKDLDNKEYLISLVINKDKDVLGRVDYYKPVKFSISGIGVYIQYPVETSIPDKAKIAMEKLDKYVKDNDTHVVTDNRYHGWLGYGRESGYNDISTRKELSKGERRKIRKIFGLSHEQAERYETCQRSDCDRCPDMQLCTQYCLEIDSVY